MIPRRLLHSFGGLLLSAVLLLPLAQPVHADGWPQRRGHGYYKIGFRALRASTYYEPGGTRLQIPTVSDYTLSFYGEYGVTDRITAVAYVPFVERITLNEQVGRTSGFVFSEGDAVTSLADPIVGVRVGLVQGGPTVLAASLRLGLPLGNSDQPNGLFTGDGELNQHLALEAGHSFYPAPAYASASAGFNNRVSGFSDEVVYALEGGYTVAGSVTLVARVRGVEPARNGDPTIGGQRGLHGNDQRYLAYGAELVYTRHDAYGLSLGAESATRTQNVLGGVAFSVGVFLKR